MTNNVTVLYVTLICAFFYILLSADEASAATASEWKNRTIYQLLTDRFAQTPGRENPSQCATNQEYEVRRYCGGTFNGIVSKLDYIKALGFDAIWISPVDNPIENETVHGVGWHGYWPQDKYFINPHFGTPDELMNLVDAAHAKGIWVMIDVVANHMGPQQGKAPGTADYVSIYNPFNDVNDYHWYCDICTDCSRCTCSQGNNEYCSLGGSDLPLPDLNTENPSTAAKLNIWVRNLVTTYKFDGIRIDAMKHVRPDFWKDFTKFSGVFSIGEIADIDINFVGSYQRGGYVDSTLGFPLAEKIAALYKTPYSNMYEIRDVINANRQYFTDTLVLGNFVDNHDKPRILGLTRDLSLARNAIAFVLLYDGIPIIYHGTEQHLNSAPTGTDPYNREVLWPSNYSTSTPLFKFISTLNTLRKYLPSNYYSSLAIEAWIDVNIYAFFKDKMLVITMNYGSGADINNGIYVLRKSITIQGNGLWAIGEKLINVVNCTESVTIDGNGNALVNLYGEPKVLYPSRALVGSSICGL